MHRHLAPTAQRARRLLDHRLRPLAVSPSEPLAVSAATPVFEPVPLTEAEGFAFEPFDVGSPWGLPWHTTWFRLRGRVPEEWSGHTFVLHLDLGFSGRSDGFQAEGLVYHDGRLLHAVQPDRRLVLLDAAAGADVDLLVEAASNPIMSDDPGDVTYRPTAMGDPATAPQRPLYVLRRAELGVLQPDVEALALDVHLALDLLLGLPADDPLVARLVVALEQAIAAVDLDDVAGTAAVAREPLSEVFSVPAAPGQHRLVGVGHAHLDTAWLWPVRETRRKVVRTVANALDLLDRYPEHRFAHSQAQHYAWLEADRPDLFERVREHVAARRWEPVGGMWVEADLNSSGGEALVRQLLHGQRAFERWFGRRCTGGFLPDDFGYPAALPQLLHRAGCRWFFTQKLSWNETNRFPHHTFWWEGLDGSRVLTHFSPVETYNATLMPSQLRFAAANFADHGGASSSLLCFGHGDGGGGPTATMLERARRLANVQGLPRLEIGTVEGFFAETEDEYGALAATWVGEMYLEKHRGTFSSQVGTKQAMARAERLLREAELWSVSSVEWPADELDGLWKRLLTQQFHDILPGSSIAWVHQDAERELAEVADAAEALVERSLSGTETAIANPAPFRTSGVVVLPGGAPSPEGAQALADGRLAVPVDLPALAAVGISEASVPPPAAVVVERHGDRVTVDNGLVRLAWDAGGRLVEHTDLRAGRAVAPVDRVAGGLVLRADQPAEYDAWDIDEPDARRAGVAVEPDGPATVVDHGPLVVTVRVSAAAGRSRFTHDVTVTAGSARVDHVLDARWHEDERRLSFELATDVHAREATCGVQFGHVRRPRHHNTSWDAARFETCAHRYVHVGERGFGVALVAAGPRGVDVRGDRLGITLLRSPRYPDPAADRGRRRVEWSVWSHTGDPFDAGLEAVAHQVAHPVRWAGRVVAAIVVHDLPAVVEAVKCAEDGSGDVVVRIWEPHGGRATGRLVVAGLATSAAHACNLLEDHEQPLAVDDGRVSLHLRPFEIATVRLRGGSSVTP